MDANGWQVNVEMAQLGFVHSHLKRQEVFRKGNGFRWSEIRRKRGGEKGIVGRAETEVQRLAGGG